MARIDSSIGIRCRRYRTHGCENTKGVRKMGMFCTTCAPKYADRKHWEALEYVSISSCSACPTIRVARRVELTSILRLLQHRQRQRAYQDYKKTRSDQCRRCNKKPMPGSPLCMRHYKEHAEAQPATMRRKRKQLRKEGLKCTTCRHLLPTGWKTHTCRGCIVRNRLVCSLPYALLSIALMLVDSVY